MQRSVLMFLVITTESRSCHIIFQMCVVEAIHYRIETKQGKTLEKYQIGTFGIPMYFVRLYQFVGVFLFGAAVEQTTTNILKYSTGKT